MVFSFSVEDHFIQRTASITGWHSADELYSQLMNRAGPFRVHTSVVQTVENTNRATVLGLSD